MRDLSGGLILNIFSQNYQHHYINISCVIFQTDYDMIDYLNELRDGCLESYTGMVQGLKGDGDAPSRKSGIL